MKTGALLHFACIAGGILGGASAKQLEALSRYGRAVGIAFQIADDLLDVEGDAATVGKATGKDAAHRQGDAGVGCLASRPRASGSHACVAEAKPRWRRSANAARILRETARFMAAREK